jgi:hypothetical protein
MLKNITLTTEQIARDEKGRAVANHTINEDAVKVYLDHVKLIKLYREEHRRSMSPDIYYPDWSDKDNLDRLAVVRYELIPDCVYVHDCDFKDHGIAVVIGRGSEHDEDWLRYISPTGTWEIGIHADGAGWVEHREWGEVAGLTIEQGELVDYDGCDSLYDEVIAILEAIQVRVSSDFYDLASQREILVEPVLKLKGGMVECSLDWFGESQR